MILGAVEAEDKVDDEAIGESVGDTVVAGDVVVILFELITTVLVRRDRILDRTGILSSLSPSLMESVFALVKTG